MVNIQCSVSHASKVKVHVLSDIAHKLKKTTSLPLETCLVV